MAIEVRVMITPYGGCGKGHEANLLGAEEYSGSVG